MHGFITPSIIYLENTDLMSYASVPDIGMFHYRISKSKSYLFIPPQTVEVLAT